VEVPSADQFSDASAVKGVEVTLGTLWIHVTAAGEAAANRMSAIASRSSGIVQRVSVRENDRVEAGDLLVQLDTIEAAMGLAQAEASVLQAQVSYREQMLRAGEILDPAVAAERERIVRIASGLTGAEVALERARMDLEQTRVRAPFAGRVANLNAVEGAYLASGQEVMTLVQLDPIRVEVDVLEGQLPLLAPGRKAQIRFTAIPGQSFPATIESINPIVDRATSSGRVTLTLPNPRGAIFPGMYATATIEAEGYANRTLIPREAVLERGTDRREMVFLFLPRANGATEGKAAWRYVTTGRRNDSLVEILESTDPNSPTPVPGEIVLVDGHHYIAHDVEVRLTDNVQAAGGIAAQ
jgi:HlyD family secretion protein